MRDIRGSIRIATGMAVAFSSAGEMSYGTIMNMGVGGIFLKTTDVQPVDTELALRIRLPDDLQTMDIAGRVVWEKKDSCTTPSGMGIEFIRLSPANRRRIEQFVAVRASCRYAARQSEDGVRDETVRAPTCHVWAEAKS